MDERLEKQLAFSLEIDKVKNILRQTHLSEHGRRENDAEHSWHMAVMAYLLREYANEPVDIGRVMLMCLIHDIVEIDAGDTYAYDSNSQVTQKEREDRAKERIFALLPEDQKSELISLFDEFEANETPEAKYAHSLDNVQPLMLNNSNGGADWREHGVSAEQVYRRHSKTRPGSEKLYEISDAILQANIEKGNIKRKKHNIHRRNVMSKILIVVDMQNDFIDGALGTKEAVAIVPYVKDVIESFEGKVYFTRDTHFENYMETQEGANLPVPHCIKDTDGWQIRAELDALRKTEAIDKLTFGSSALVDVLKAEKDIESITFVGLCTDICVISNAMVVKAFFPEVPLIVDAKGCAGVSPESHQRALEAMKVCQIKIIND